MGKKKKRKKIKNKKSKKNTNPSGQKVDGLVDTTERGDINSLTTDSSSSTNTGGILTRSSVDDSVNKDLERVLVSEEVDDLEGVLDDTDGHDLLSVVPPVHHEGVGQTLDDGALSLTETLDVVPTGSMGKVVGEFGVLFHSKVILEGNVLDLDIPEGPFTEELDVSGSHRWTGRERREEGKEEKREKVASPLFFGPRILVRKESEGVQTRFFRTFLEGCLDVFRMLDVCGMVCWKYLRFLYKEIGSLERKMEMLCVRVEKKKKSTKK